MNRIMQKQIHARKRIHLQPVVLCGLLLVFPSLLEGMAETITGLDIPHPAPFGLALGVILLLKQKFLPVAPAMVK